MGVTSSKSKQLQQLFHEQEQQQAERAKTAALAAASSLLADKTTCRTPRRGEQGSPASVDYNRIGPGTLSSLDRKSVAVRKRAARGSRCTCWRGRVSIKQTASANQVEICGVRFTSAADWNREKVEAEAKVSRDASGSRAEEARLVAAVEQSRLQAGPHSLMALHGDDRKLLPLWARRSEPRSPPAPPSRRPVRRCACSRCLSCAHVLQG